MNWGTYDANAHVPQTDIMQQTVTNDRSDTVYQSRTTGGSDYTLADIVYGEIPVTHDTPKDD